LGREEIFSQEGTQGHIKTAGRRKAKVTEGNIQRRNCKTFLVIKNPQKKEDATINNLLGRGRGA